MFETCHADQHGRDQDNTALRDYRLMSAARALISSHILQTSHAMLNMIAQAGGMSLSTREVDSEALSRVESLLLGRQFELQAPLGRPSVAIGQTAPRRARL